MLSEISVKVFRSGRKLVGPVETDIVYAPSCIDLFSAIVALSLVPAFLIQDETSTLYKFDGPRGTSGRTYKILRYKSRSSLVKI
jgi:hypothetical protein